MSAKHAVFLVFWYGGLLALPLTLAVFVNTHFVLAFWIAIIIFLGVEGNAIADHDYHVTPLNRMHVLKNELHKAKRVQYRIRDRANEMRSFAEEMEACDQHYEAELLRINASVLELDLGMAVEDVRLKEMKIRRHRMIELTEPGRFQKDSR